MKKRYGLLYFFIILPVSLFAQPTITNFYPLTGNVGSTVFINGSGFSTNLSDNIVFFGAVRATVTYAIADRIYVTVPAGSTYLPISVTVNGLTAYSYKPFVSTFPHVLFHPFSFEGKKDFASGDNPVSLSTGDIDGDGKVDIASSNNIPGPAGIISVFRNISIPGDVLFEPSLSIPAGSGNIAEKIRDIDGDGKPDLIVVNQNDNTVSVFRNMSSPGFIQFAAPVNFATGLIPSGVDIGDLDGDGRPDIMIVNHGSNTISILLNTGSPGNILFAPKVDFATGNEPTGGAIGYIAQDPKPDIVVANTGSDSVSIFRNMCTPGNISFTPRADFWVRLYHPLNITFSRWEAFPGEDANQFFITDDSANVFSLTHVRQIQGALVPDSLSVTAHPRPVYIAAGDMNGDGRVDIAMACPQNNLIGVFGPNTYSGGIPYLYVDYAAGAYPLCTVIADFDGDGKADIGMCNSHSMNISILRNNLSFPCDLKDSIVVMPQKCAVNNGAIISNITKGTPPYQFLWSNGAVTADITDLASGSYFFTVKDDNNCELNSGIINVPHDTLAPLTAMPAVMGLCPGKPLVLTPGNFASYLWQDNSTAASYTVTATGIYSVIVIDSNGCRISAVTEVITGCSDLFFPSAFTPNGDSKNDGFGPAGVNFFGITNYQLVVYNRYGKVVFRSSNPYKKWDGSYKGQAPRNESFVWVASFYNNGRKDFRKGSVTLIK